jgi:hypothetical protein
LSQGRPNLTRPNTAKPVIRLFHGLQVSHFELVVEEGVLRYRFELQERAAPLDDNQRVR